MTAAAIPPWLFDACYESVGDLAETISLLLPPSEATSDASLASWIEERIRPLAQLEPASVQRELIASWSQLDRDGRFLFVKLLTGALRVGVGRELVHRALADIAGVPAVDIAQHLTGPWHPSAMFWDEVRGKHSAEAPHRPYPFCLAHALDAPVDTLGAREAWQAEWKWDGVRVQLMARHGTVTLWSRGEELVTDQFPEIAAAGRRLAHNTVLDGEIVAWRIGDEHPASFALLQRRLGRKAPGPTTLRDFPVRMIAFDVLESAGDDWRAQPLSVRRRALEGLVSDLEAVHICTSPLLTQATWHELSDARSTAREHNAEGLMLKRVDSAYAAGRTRGTWWKWKIEPYRVDAVLLYAQPGSGRRASLLTDYTFGVWDQGALVPFAKAYSGLTDAELRQVDNWIRLHTVERFGPVRHVEPIQVFELAFEAIQVSTRHKSGVAVRFPRIARWRRDKLAQDADTLDTLRALASASP